MHASQNRAAGLALRLGPSECCLWSMKSRHRYAQLSWSQTPRGCISYSASWERSWSGETDSQRETDGPDGSGTTSWYRCFSQQDELWHTGKDSAVPNRSRQKCSTCLPQASSHEKYTMSETHIRRPDGVAGLSLSLCWSPEHTRLQQKKPEPQVSREPRRLIDQLGE